MRAKLRFKFEVSVKMLFLSYCAHTNTSHTQTQPPNMGLWDLIKQCIQQTDTSNHNHLCIFHISAVDQTPKPPSHLPKPPK